MLSHPAPLCDERVQREAGNLAARFYRLLAGTGGNREGLNYAQESELFSIMEEAGTRQDFALFNRMQKFALGPAGGKAMRRMRDTLKSRSMSSTRRTRRNC